MEQLNVVGLVSRSSVSYIRHVFALGRARQPLVNVRDEAAARELQGLVVDGLVIPAEGGGWFADAEPLIDEDRPAQVTYTSGTEGLPKGIVLTYANLADAAGRIIAQMQMTADIREYVGIPVTYSFGMGRIRAIAAVGGRAYLPARSFDPLEFARMLKDGEVNALSAVPTLLRIVLASPEIIGSAGAKLRWLEIGSQFMSAAEKRAVRELFPNARIVQHYGLTEASRSTFLTVSEATDQQLESVGQPVGRTEIGVSADGRIRIRGPHVARWRIEDGRLRETCDADGWFQTNDLGHLRDGFLHFDGRADDLINVSGVKVNPDQVEDRIRSICGDDRIVVARVRDALRGDGVLVATDSPALDLQRLQQVSNDVLREAGLEAAGSLHVLSVPGIPRTATGKPIRREVARLFEESAATSKSTAPEQAGGGNVMGLFRTFFPGRKVSASDSFESMGGDSLNYIQFSMAYERRFGALPSGWQSIPVAQLESGLSGNKGGFWRRLDTATLNRAFFMICIVAWHLDVFLYSENWGAAYALYMLAGYSLMRFQWPEISRTGSVSTVLSTALRVAIPAVLVLIGLQLLARNFELLPLLLISNFFDPSRYDVQYFYFAEMYIQLILFAAAMLSIPAIRRRFQQDAFHVSAFLTTAAFVCKEVVDRFWTTDHIFHRSPHWYAWAFACGMMMASARSTRQRVLALALIVILELDYHGPTSAAWYIIGACALMLFVPELLVPAPLKSVVSVVAGSSMFLYLSHGHVATLVNRLLPEPSPWIALIASILFGIVFGAVYGKAESLAWALYRKYRSARAATPQVVPAP